MSVRVPTLVAVTVYLVCMALAMPSAAAQTPSTVMTVTISNAPAEFPALESNASAIAAFKVDVTLANVVCPPPNGGLVTVTITATQKTPAAFFSVAAEPAEITVPVSAGPHGSPPAGSAWTESIDAAVRANVTTIDANASIPVEIVATATATGCEGTGGAMSATSEPVTIFANMTAPPPPTPEPTPEENGLPGPGALMGVLASLAAASLRRRRS